MPYIKPERRHALSPTPYNPPAIVAGPGELNYVITEACTRYLRHHGLSYQAINDVLGALSGAKDEFYRRVAAPFEDRKAYENGDVYG